jgi:dienelactone hydrolase
MTTTHPDANAIYEPVVRREKLSFQSGDTTCAALHYPGTNGGCVVMAGGAGVTKEPGTDPFARRFNEAGFSVLAFDFRHFGESGGEPRQVVRLRGQQADYEAAIEFASTLPGVDPGKLAIWGFSLAGGHVLAVAARNPGPVLAEPGVRAAQRAPRGEVVDIPGGHYEPFLGAYEMAVEVQLRFLRRHVLRTPAATEMNERQAA